MNVYFSSTLKWPKTLLIMSCLESMETRKQNEDTEITNSVYKYIVMR